MTLHKFRNLLTGEIANFFDRDFMIYLKAILPSFFSPLSVILFLIIFSIFTKSRWPSVVAAFLLILLSNSFFSNFALQYLEKSHPPILLEDSQHADFALVLSGMTRKVSNDTFGVKYEYTEAIDRFEAALTLLRLGKVKKVIFTRGASPWSKSVPEGELLAKAALDRGVMESQIILTDIAFNTEQEAKVVMKLVNKEQQIALITSAYHMPRALDVFVSKGIKVLPVPVDHRATEISKTSFYSLINAEALFSSSLVFRELLARAYYKVAF